MATKCKFVNDKGEACKAYEAKGTGYCMGHARQLGLAQVEPKVQPTITVSEPRAVTALREMTTRLELGGQIDPVAATELANILRPYLGLPMMDSVALVGQIDTRRKADEQIAEQEFAEQALIERSRNLIVEDQDPDMKRRIEEKVARDLQAAAGNYTAKMVLTRQQLAAEQKVQVNGAREDELYVLNGVKVVVPADGQYLVPRTIAEMHKERMFRYREVAARSALMNSTPEFSEVQRAMASIDGSFNSRSQLGGGSQEVVSDYLVAEEIK